MGLELVLQRNMCLGVGFWWMDGWMDGWRGGFVGETERFADKDGRTR